MREFQMLHFSLQMCAPPRFWSRPCGRRTRHSSQEYRARVDTCVASSVGQLKPRPSLAENAPEPSSQGAVKAAGLARLCGLTSREGHSHKKHTGNPFFPLVLAKGTNVGVEEGMPALESSVRENEGGSRA